MFWKRFFIAAGLLAIFVFIAQLVAAPYAKRLIITEAKKTLGANISIGDCSLSLLKRKMTLEDIVVANPDNKNDYVIKAKELSVDFYLLPFLFNKQVLRFVSLTNAEIILCRDKSGALRYPQFKLPEGAGTAKKSKPVILFGKLSINNGNVKFIDQRVSSPSTVTTFSNIDCVISNSFSLLERRVITGVAAKGKIEEQGSFYLSAKGDFFSKPMSFKGDLEIKDVLLPKFYPYYGNNLSIEIKSGNLSISTAALCDKGELDVKSKVRIDNVYVEPKGDPEKTILFELKTSDVLELLKDENNGVNFTFEIKGNLGNPEFEWGSEMRRALKQAMMRNFSDGIGRLLQQPQKMGEKIGKILGGEAGEAAKKIGEQLQKMMGK